MGSISGQGTAGAKVVLSTKMGTPVTFQQGKNFQQSFATWVKQGQSTQGQLRTHCLVFGFRSIKKIDGYILT